MTAARERARRAACSANLDELGKGFENYLGQYGGYYPGGCRWDPATKWHNTPAQIPPYTESYAAMCTISGGASKQYQRVMVSHQAVDPKDAWRAYDGAVEATCIAVGNQPGLGSSVLGSDEVLKCAPWGMGWLINTGTVPDPRAFYCPSAGPQNGHTTSPAAGGDQDESADPDTIREWAAAGPFSAKTLTHGNWPMDRLVGGALGGEHYGVYSQYMYRNQPVISNKHTNAYYSEYVAGGVRHKELEYPFTNPSVIWEGMCPPFKTPKFLKGRVLVSDSYRKPGVAATPGFGNKAHKDGYNILTGDYSTKWYSDAEKRIMYWNPASVSNTTGSILPETNYCGGLVWSSDPAGYYSTSIRDAKPSAFLLTPLVWHTLDVSVGVDTQVDVTQWFADRGW